MTSGIDIYTEVYYQGQWVSADTWKMSIYDDSWGGNWFVSTTGYLGDRYSRYLSGILADYHNYNELRYIAPLKGLPSDLSFDVKRKYEHGYAGQDLPSGWLTVTELLQFDWTQTTQFNTRVSAYQYYLWQLEGFRIAQMPFTSKWYRRDYHYLVDEAEMVEVLRKTLESKNIMDDYTTVAVELQKYYCRISRELPYYALVPDLWSQFIPHLLSRGKPEDVRIVFWFA